MNVVHETGKQQKTTLSQRPDLDMTPMVDVTFLLLIFFMITASFTLQTSIQMPRQTSQLPSRNTDEQKQHHVTISLHVDRVGSFYLATPDWDKEVIGKQSLVTCLRNASSQTNSDARLDILVDSQSRLQSLVDAIDAGSIAGFSSQTVRETDHDLLMGT